jgi:hypothetical protein
VIDGFSARCAKDGSCRRRTDDLTVSLRRTAADMPDKWLFLPIESGNVRLASFFGSMETTMENAPLNAPMTLGAWLSADDGDASGLWLQSVLADVFFPTAFVWGEAAATGLEDAKAAKAYYAAGGDHGSIFRNPGTDFIWAGGRLPDAWPAGPDTGRYDRMQTSDVETLVVSGELDLTTPRQVAAKELMPYLPNGRQVVLPGFAHTLDVWTYQPEANTRLLTAFFDTGKVDRSLYKPQRVDFTPEVTVPVLAKGIAGAMAALAAIAALSLLWLPARALRRGRFGRRSRALLRSVYPIVLGLGGWFLGVLIVLAAFPTVPLDDAWLTVLSVGGPVGLGIYWAWFERASSFGAKLAGLVAAAAGGAAGAWLGFSAASDMLALVTAVVGSTAGANLALIAVDIRRDRSARDRVAESTFENTLEARPATG